MPLAPGLRLVNRGVESFLHLARGTREFDYCAAVRNAGDFEAVRLQPRADGLNVLVGGTELLAELLRREPLVIIGRGGFLLRTALQHEQHAIHCQARGSGAAIVLRLGQVIGVAPQDGELRFVYGLRYARYIGCGLRDGW